ncbi:MAG: spermine synthase [Bacteroidia bacterium]|nr:spermine synthase [Bacteroidia bacterium]MCF8428047.1 spermine synthase [Bacteroidia bacterium]MCF8447802.1 spermine synthase [Bacteroidia bacterium]
MRNILRFFIPKTRKISTEKNGFLELITLHGKTLLDSENANYSYGSLQKILSFGLHKLEWKQPQNVLVLGLGAGSVIETLRSEFSFQGEIVAVEYDAVLIDLALTEFGLGSDRNLKIENREALEFLGTNAKTYSIIIIDLFTDNKTAACCFKDEFWNNIEKAMDKSSQFIFNAAVGTDAKEEIKHWEERFKNTFEIQKFTKVKGTNTVFIGSKKRT